MGNWIWVPMALVIYHWNVCASHRDKYTLNLSKMIKIRKKNRTQALQYDGHSKSFPDQVFLTRKIIVNVNIFWARCRPNLRRKKFRCQLSSSCKTHVIFRAFFKMLEMSSIFYIKSVLCLNVKNVHLDGKKVIWETHKFWHFSVMCKIVFEKSVQSAFTS